MNDNHARAMKAEASDPASAATPTNRGTSATKTWLSTTIAMPATIAGGDRGTPARRGRWKLVIDEQDDDRRDGGKERDRADDPDEQARDRELARHECIDQTGQRDQHHKADDRDADQHDDEQATRRPFDDVAFGVLGEDARERDIECAVELADRPDDAEHADQRGERRSVVIASTAP